MKILMIARSDYHSDVRVRREAETLNQAGHTVDVLCHSPDEEVGPGLTLIGLPRTPGLTTHRVAGNGLLYRALRWLLLPNHRSRALKQFEKTAFSSASVIGLKPDVIHAHDYTALVPSARLAKTMECRLVYDAHEYWPGIQRHGRPSPLVRRRESRTERAIARSADAVVTVSDGAAELMRQRADISEVTVVRNTFPVDTNREGTGNPTGLVYPGRVSHGRDLETVFGAARLLEGELDVHVIGPEDGTLTVPAPVHLHSAVDMDTLNRFITEIGVVVVPLRKGPKNHDIALPNKLFQAAALGVPVVAADLPEIRRVVTEFGLGELYQPGESRSLVEAVRKTISDYDEIKAKVLASRHHLEWSVDAKRLLNVYATLVA